MSDAYDKYYQTENLFGEPYPELIRFFTDLTERGSVLDLGCGQGRNALALARLGYTVTGIDISRTGIEQMNKIARSENLALNGTVDNIYTFNRIDAFDIVLLDSIFHFAKKDREKESLLLQKIQSELQPGGLLVICLQDTGNKVKILNQILDSAKKLNKTADKKFTYLFEDKSNDHSSLTKYRMIVAENKLN